MSDSHQLIVALAQQRHRARYEVESHTAQGLVRYETEGRSHLEVERSNEHRAEGRRATGVRARVGWLLVAIGLRLAASGDRPRKTALLGR